MHTSTNTLIGGGFNLFGLALCNFQKTKQKSPSAVMAFEKKADSDGLLWTHKNKKEIN